MDTNDGTVLVCTGDREDLLLDVGGASAVRVVALTDTGAEQVREELQLLAALEVAGCTAAPAVLDLEDEGYVREGGVLLRRGRGRRAAAVGTPGTGERLVLARAREQLDFLVSAVHERGWVLGCAPGEGLAVREDGTVLLRDLSGLRREDSTMAQMDDRAWVDSVLHDQDRTLRRRIDTAGLRGEETRQRQGGGTGQAVGVVGQIVDAAESDETGETGETGEPDEFDAAPTALTMLPLPEPRSLRHTTRGGRGPRHRRVGAGEWK